MTEKRYEHLTIEELKLLEERPKSLKQQIWDGIICLLPLVSFGLALAEYLIAPNLEGNETTPLYAWFLTALAGLWGVRLLIGVRTHQGRKDLRYRAPFRTLVFFLFLLYDYATLKTGKLPLPYFPWVDQILNAILKDRAYLFDCTWHSLYLLFTGYFFGVLSGLLTGIAIGYSKKIDYWLAPFMKLMGAIPGMTWIPLIMILASSLFKGAVFVIALGVWYCLAMATATGLRHIDRSYYDAARILGARGIQLVTHVALPFALPNILHGLILGMSSACVSLLAAEMLGVESGLGWYIVWQKSWAQYAKMYAAIFLLCVIFVVVNWVLAQFKARMLRWEEGVTN